MKIRRFLDTGEWTTRRYLSLLGSVLIWAIVAIDAFYLWPTQLQGSTSMVIVSGHSMDPTYFTGDLVIARKMEPSVGDVIVYAPEGFGGSQIVHRIVGGNAVDGWVMQGDNNAREDPFTPKGEEVKGVVLVHYANFGRVTGLLLNPMVWAFVLLAAIVLLVWWSSDTCEDDDDDENKSDSDREPEPEPEEEPDLIDRVVEGTEAAIARMAASIGAAGVAALSTLTHRSPAPRHATSVTRRIVPVYMRGSAIVAVLGLVAIFGPSIASASSLAITTKGNIFTKTYTPCTTAALSAAPSGAATGTNYTKLVVSTIPTSCNGKSITMYAYDSSGVLLMSSGLSASPPATTGTGGTVTFTKASGSYNAAAVSKVYVFIDTWGIQTTWTYTAPPPAPPAAATCVPTNSSGVAVTGTCTVSDLKVEVPWGSPGSRSTNSTFKVNSSTGWFKITFDFSQAPLPGWSPHSISGNFTLPPLTTCSALPSVTVLGPSWSTYMAPSYEYFFGFSESSGNICH